MSYQHMLTAVDTHTAGEPTRIITAGLPLLPGQTMAEKRNHLRAEYDYIRSALMLEPRGHKDMFGAFLMAPTRPEADLGVIFMDNAGYLSMCGHGSIGVAVVALETGLIPRQEPETPLVLDTPAGLVRIRASLAEGRLRQVVVENVAGFLAHSRVPLSVPDVGQITLDVAFGGNFFALVSAAQLGLSVHPNDLPELMRQGMAIRQAANDQLEVQHPTQPHINEIELVEIYEDWPEKGAKNVVVFGQNQVDRSPCGTGTCAKMALLYETGRLELNETFTHESILGTRFTGRLLRQEMVGSVSAVVPEIGGMAYITGYQQFVIDPDDPLKAGFLLDGS